MTYKPTIFPTLIDSIWSEVNLGEESLLNYPKNDDINPLLDPQFCNEWIKGIANKIGADFTWGGHFEDRKHLWRGYYDSSPKVTHLGIDYNVPSGTPVTVPRDCEVVHSWADDCIHNGWGGRLILKLAESWENAPYLLLGHLSHTNLPVIGDKFLAGEIVAKTGIPIENGGWFPHLHVQCINEDFFQEYKDDLKELDGYYLIEGEPHDLAPSPKYLVGQDIV